MPDSLHGAKIVYIYYVATASGMIALCWLVRIPDELFRKLLHFVLLFSYIPFAFVFRKQEAMHAQPLTHRLGALHKAKLFFISSHAESARH